ncbi:putative DNA directed RNA polymerase III polypeptide K variant 2 [Taeniopygia guttata]|uniref:Putative DNA directed RNA polymerase III polypeptide K variant 2 n=1 Tax=Taeniopygia guttata TaxID=59729 RepID=B5G0B9_TAEGU|nr:putative DNA directed RNA polymerase III polypeptide K variant 2 [Taeniopygia guttata]ACH44730.1 putative DNA directed RNA polymerase III polypeptide K variant 2 [Taeniopygia guttata]
MCWAAPRPGRTWTPRQSRAPSASTPAPTSCRSRRARPTSP